MGAPTLTLTTRIVATKEQVSANVAGESVILGMRDGVYYGLDRVGTRVWELLQAPRTLDDVADIVTAEFDTTRDVAAAHLIAFATDLLAHGLVDVAGP